MARRKAGSEIHRLVHEMERVDCALAEHLQGLHAKRTRSRTGGSRTPPLDFARAQIKAWCAAHHGKYDAEVLASTIMAVDTMTRRELAALLRGLAWRLKAERRRRPAA